MSIASFWGVSIRLIPAQNQGGQAGQRSDTDQQEDQRKATRSILDHARERLKSGDEQVGYSAQITHDQSQYAGY